MSDHVCRACGAAIEDDSGSCRACGAALQPRCPDCGQRVHAAAQFCVGCGARLAEAEEPADDLTDMPAVCPHCGRAATQADRFCQGCGRRLVDDQSLDVSAGHPGEGADPSSAAETQEQAQEQGTPVAEQRALHCEGCGRTLAAGLRFCTGCGRPVGTAEAVPPAAPMPSLGVQTGLVAGAVAHATARPARATVAPPAGRQRHWVVTAYLWLLIILETIVVIYDVRLILALGRLADAFGVSLFANWRTIWVRSWRMTRRCRKNPCLLWFLRIPPGTW